MGSIYIDPTPGQIEKLTTTAIADALKNLIENKHVFGSVNIDLIKVNSLISEKVKQYDKQEREEQKEQFESHSKRVLSGEWLLQHDFLEELTIPHEKALGRGGPFAFKKTVIQLPTVKLSCKCDNAIWPHNSGYKAIKGELLHYTKFTDLKQGGVVQIFSVPYQCQSCKRHPVIFFIRKEKGKEHYRLRIVGRSEFESVYCPKQLPQEEQKFYQEAIVAFHGGKTLAGIFFLRTFVEQYIRRILNKYGREPGEVLAKDYAKLLPDDFPSTRVTSIATIYEELSVCIHSAKAKDEQFEKSRNDIETHFKYLDLFPLSENTATS